MPSRIAYFDCFAGISGDMCLGALVDAGVKLAAIRKDLGKIPIANYRVTSKKVLRAGINATKVDVTVEKPGGRKPEARQWKDIKKLIDGSSLPSAIKQKGLHIFKALFEAEARVHGMPFDATHLHELGCIDCVVDILGTLLGLSMLGIEEVYVSSINLGSGMTPTSHGLLPVPAPATIELLKGYPVYSTDTSFEMTTPTGAAIISGLNARFAPLPPMNVETIAYGAGSRDVAAMPNALRLFVGSSIGHADCMGPAERVVVIETNIDDMNPQIFEEATRKLFDAGALDVFLDHIIMKKGRPAVKLSIIAREQDTESLADIVLRETTSIGLRYYHAQRKTLERETKTVSTKFGDVRIKVSRQGDSILNVSPEYEDVKALSRKLKLPIKRLLAELPKYYPSK